MGYSKIVRVQAAYLAFTKALKQASLLHTKEFYDLPANDQLQESIRIAQVVAKRAVEYRDATVDLAIEAGR
jgi:non-canonical (house-cleaning) NTP pyrophosphatase